MNYSNQRIRRKLHSTLLSAVAMIGCLAPCAAQVAKDGDVLPTPDGADGLTSCKDCNAEGENGQGVEIAFVVTRAADSDDKNPAKDFHIRTTDTRSRKFKCWKVEKYDADTKSYKEVQKKDKKRNKDGWSFGIGSVEEDETNQHYLNWYYDGDDKEKMMQLADDFRFSVVYCG